MVLPPKTFFSQPRLELILGVYSFLDVTTWFIKPQQHTMKVDGWHYKPVLLHEDLNKRRTARFSRWYLRDCYGIESR